MRQTIRGADEQAVGVRPTRGLVPMLQPHLSWAVSTLTPVLTGCAVPRRDAPAPFRPPWHGHKYRQGSVAWRLEKGGVSQ